MKIEVRPEQHVIIVGGGIAGLATAWYLQQADIDYTLLEASERLGGLIHTHYEHECIIEFGPDAFITRKPWALELAQEIRLSDELIAVNDTEERIYVLSDGNLVPLPDGLRLLVPTNLNAFMASPLMSWAGKLRVLMDYVIPAHQDESDESLANFVRRRFGDEALDKLAEPLLAGVYNADMNEQSILATFPQYRKLEQVHGSLIRGMAEAVKNAPPTDVPPLLSFKQGMSQLVDTLVQKLTGDIRLNSPVTNITDKYKVRLENGTIIEADSLVIATPANIASQLLAFVAEESANHLATIRYAGIGSISLVYDLDDVPTKLDAYGVVIPSSANRMIDGLQWSSAKWQHRAPENKALIRVFFGGTHTRNMLDTSDSEILAIVREELRAIMGITAKPQSYALRKWHNAYPQYDVGHIERMASIETCLPPNIALAGNAYHGVGIPDTIKTAKAAAHKLTQITLN